MRAHKARNREFASQIERAEAVAEASLLIVVQRAATKGDWRPAAWALERRWPERWARPEIRGDLALVALNPQDVARAIHLGLAAIAKRHADFSQLDIEDDPMHGRDGGPVAPALLTVEPAATVTRS